MPPSKRGNNGVEEKMTEDDSKAMNDKNDKMQFSPELQEFIFKNNKPYVSVFMEMYQKVYGVVPEMIPSTLPGDEPNSVLFLYSVYVGDQKVPGVPVRTKKAAKFNCMKRALQVLYDSSAKAMFSTSCDLQLEMEDTLFELMRQHTYSKFYSLASTDPSILGLEKVMASIFLFNSSDSSMKIISLATGSKCIRGDCLSLSGSCVQDCHAEILARRGLLRFFYAQILLCLRDPEKSIFIVNSSGKLSVRPGLSFHLFINTAPCGDGRVYERENSEKQAARDNRNAGKLRYKVESGMGSVLGRPFYNPQTIDGIRGGERLRTMSCSDKILRWNALGVQGALLTRFMAPVYLSSLTVAELMGESRLERAVSGRLNGLQLTAPFSVNRPLLTTCQKAAAPRDVARRAQDVACNWNVTDNTLESLNTVTGLVPTPKGDETTECSRLCKKEMATLFKKVCVELRQPVPDGFSYENLKASCEEYELARQTLEQWFRERSLGHWHSKPEDVAAFVV